MKIETNDRIQVRDNFISCPDVNVRNPRGMGNTLFQKMKEHKDAVAQIDGLTGKKDTYKHYLQRCIRSAMTMRLRGVMSKDVISICSLNHMNVSVPYISALFLGAIPACLDPNLTASVTSHILKQVRPKMIFVGPEAEKLIQEAVAESGIDAQIVTFGMSEKHSQFSEFLAPFPDENSFIPIEVANIKDTAIILFSSGTTGFPKGICLSHYGLFTPMGTSYLETDVSVALLFASMYWISSTLFLLLAIAKGTARVIVPRFDPDTAWDLIEKFKVTTLFAAPVQIITISRSGRPKDEDVSSLRHVLLAGSAISREKVKELRSVFKGALVSNSYGLTELNGFVLSLRYLSDPVDKKLFLEKPHTIGRPMNGITYKVVNPETEEVLGPNQPGELRMKAEFQMNGYHNLDSSRTWDADGFLKTGDLVYYDKDYGFYYIDRIAEILRYRTYRVLPSKIEAVLLSNPAVESAVVFGLPHPQDGDHPSAVVALTKTAVGKVTARELEKYVEERVEDFEKLRGGVRIAKTIFVTANGKLSRRRIKDLVLRGDI